MALPHEFDQIIKRVQLITGDSKFIRWSKDELILYINEAQREYCEKTMILRAESPLTVRENSEIYTLPDDCFIVDRIERSDGNVISKTTSRDLQRRFSDRYRKDVGNPEFYYQDLDGQRQLRFYPIPSEDILGEYSNFIGELGAVYGIDDVDLQPLVLDGVQIFNEEDPAYLANATPIPFESEFGVTIDSTLENEFGIDDNHFNFEEGAVTGVLVTEGKFRVWYVRYPREDKREIDDDQAMQYYTLHKLYEKDGPQMNPELSIMYEQRYQERVNREVGRVSSGQHADMSCRGVYD